MKFINLFFVLLLLGGHSFAQDDAIRKYFDKYAEDERFSSVYISNKMFSLFSNVGDVKDSRELKEVLDKLGGLRILSSDATDGTVMYREADRLLVSKGFEDLMVIREKGKPEFKFLIKEIDGKVRELLMLSGQGKQFFMLSIIGDIDLKKISRLAKGLDVQGLDQLDQLNKK